MYAQTQTHIGPEYIQWLPKYVEGVYSPEHEVHKQQEEKLGYWVSDARYMLRPETVESYFYAYRITGERVYQDWAWEAYESIVRATLSNHGYAEVEDVTREAGPENRKDGGESFWGAETLKYLYMVLAEEEVGDLDKWVFSTGEFSWGEGGVRRANWGLEAHPFRIQKR